jgi:ubiquinol-cytochrome c reductase cytochrome b subunit
MNLMEWLDNRTGCRGLVRAALYEPIPGGARWRYVWGSTLVMAFATQVVTGLFLWMAYSPSTQSAWESVFYIQHEMWGGWLLRGVHHYSAHVMVYLMLFHFVQVVVDGAYRAPRELNFVIGLVLMFLVLGMALTGYLLPWDQKGYWATTVGTNLASQAPVVGPALRKLAIGGSEYGHHTLTRFFALHAGVLPGLMLVFLAAHIALFRRHGLHAKQPLRAPTAMFWPDQVLKDSVAALAILAGVLATTIYRGGAELGAPADPANPFDAARPEGYFLFLFQFLKWFPGELELWGAFIIPGIVTAVLFLMPWIGRSRGGHVLNVCFLFLLLGGGVLLTAQAWHDDYYAAVHKKPANPAPEVAAKFEASERFLAAQRDAERQAERAVELAMLPERIPLDGALSLLYDDPLLQGPGLFRQHCGGCHNFVNPDDPDAPGNIVNAQPTAPNLFGIGSKDWIAGWLDEERIRTPHYYGYSGSTFVDGDMAMFVSDMVADDADADDKAAAKAAIGKIVAALADAAELPDAPEPTDAEQVAIDAGWGLINGGLAEVTDGGMSCTDCHSFERGEAAGAPNLRGYLTRAWLIEFIRNPAAEHMYGEFNDRMPAFAPHADEQFNQLDDETLGLIVDWLRRDWPRAEKPAEPAAN